MLIVSALCFAALVLVPNLAHQQLLALFDGDRDRTIYFTRGMIFFLMGMGMAAAQPAIWSAFIRRAQKVIAFGGSRTPFAQAILRPRTRHLVDLFGVGMSLFFGVAASIMAVLIGRGVI